MRIKLSKHLGIKSQELITKLLFQCALFPDLLAIKLGQLLKMKYISAEYCVRFTADLEPVVNYCG